MAGEYVWISQKGLNTAQKRYTRPSDQKVRFVVLAVLSPLESGQSKKFPSLNILDTVTNRTPSHTKYIVSPTFGSLS